jgi:prevent-host-death family protein
MARITATEAKARLGEAMETAQNEPVTIQKGGRNYAVLISARDYEFFQALEDFYWITRAREAEERGEWVGHEDSMRLLAKRLEQAA